jgi:hypothetical protein
MFDNFEMLVGEDIETVGWQDTMAFAMTEVFNMNHKLCLAVRARVGSVSTFPLCPLFPCHPVSHTNTVACHSHDRNAAKARGCLSSHFDGTTGNLAGFSVLMRSQCCLQMLEAVAKVEELDLPLKNNQSMVALAMRLRYTVYITPSVDCQEFDGVS